ncbi:MAG: polya polymerase [Desulfocapsaceae bacterium]|nr:polya polymerase [Desulfocapsaceae bacterium]
MTGVLHFPDSELPRIITADSHPIRRKMIDKDAVFVMRKLNQAGFASYLVGGGVRDLYLGKPPKDFDISTDARPGQIRKLFPNSAIIGRRFRLVQVFCKSGKVIEVSTLRSLSEHDLDGPEAILAPNNTYGQLPEDAQRRDLTINSLFYELENNTIIDYTGGVNDLDRSTIRIIGEPEKRINRDPVRMMRAIRHAARTGFTIEKATWQATCDNHHKLLYCPPSRLRDELFKDLYGGSACRWFNFAIESELFFTLFPLYRTILFSSPNNQPTCREQLQHLLSLVDQINRQAQNGKCRKLSQSFLLALLLLPWAEVTYELSSLKIKGGAIYQLSKKLRYNIDELFAIPFNLRKSIRQEIVTLLANLPQFVRFVQNDTHPKWLKKKSYYLQCLLFFRLSQKAISGESSSAESLDNLVDTISADSPRHLKKSKHSKKKSRPAFSPKKKGGIFGFRK